jgi:hypothetical protein
MLSTERDALPPLGIATTTDRSSQPGKLAFDGVRLGRHALQVPLARDNRNRHTAARRARTRAGL